MSDQEADSDSVEPTQKPTNPFTTIERIEAHDWAAFDVRAVERGMVRPYHDPHLLTYLYWEEGLTQVEIAQRYNVTQQAVAYQMGKNEIPTERHPSNYRATVGYTRGDGSQGRYDRLWTHHNGNQDRVYVHRLVACVENDPHEVFRAGSTVHHETGHPLDNRPDALRVMDGGEHSRLHAAGSVRWVIEDGEPRLREEREADGPNPVDEWWHPIEGDEVGADPNGAGYELTVGSPSESNSQPTSNRDADPRSTASNRG